MIFNPLPVVYYKEPQFEELTVTQNGEYFPSTTGAGISKVTVEIPLPKLATPAIRQVGNFILVLNENGWWGNRVHFYKNDAFLITVSFKNYLNLDTVFAEFESGDFKVYITYEKPDTAENQPGFGSSEFSNVIGCQRKYYTSCNLEFAEDHFIVTGVNDTDVVSLVIPPLAELSDQVYPITEIAPNAFRDLKNITSVVGESIEVIGENAFSGCEVLQTAEFPVLKRIVGESVFAGTMLNELDLSMVDTIISSSMLINNTESVKLTMPTSTRQNYIPPYLFNKAKLENITLPENIRRIDEFAFKEATIQILNVLSKDIVFSPNAFVSSPFANNTGIVFVDYTCLERVLRETENLPLLGCVINTETDITIEGIQTLNGKNYAFQLFYSAEDAFNLYNPITNSGENYNSVGYQQYYVRLTETV